MEMTSEQAKYRKLVRKIIRTICKNLVKKASEYNKVPLRMEYVTLLEFVLMPPSDCHEIVEKELDNLISEGIIPVRKEDDNGDKQS